MWQSLFPALPRPGPTEFQMRDYERRRERNTANGTSFLARCEQVFLHLVEHSDQSAEQITASLGLSGVYIARILRHLVDTKHIFYQSRKEIRGKIHVSRRYYYPLLKEYHHVS